MSAAGSMPISLHGFPFPPTSTSGHCLLHLAGHQPGAGIPAPPALPKLELTSTVTRPLSSKSASPSPTASLRQGRLEDPRGKRPPWVPPPNAGAVHCATNPPHPPSALEHAPVSSSLCDDSPEAGPASISIQPLPPRRQPLFLD
ncbi:nascent polypeptide-associated complex subunit alpha, muscle-specific form-like [Choloepus didactylus]|uniref:nascent polypeptide-associated complex subunit alpha, muscle-specific form-like n=1 Tax=Choloepus didactylus TaxID=27675 RepID=UPI0018A08458|nr:nascent polypeptide-associated complex subunit alpha, muscle-specific form-like [Choloepus didactylus]